MIQKDRLLNLLQNNANEWVDIWTIITKIHICHYTEIIRQLRKDWYVIENKEELVKKHWEWINYSWYKLVDDEIQPTLWQKTKIFIWLN